MLEHRSQPDILEPPKTHRAPDALLAIRRDTLSAPVRGYADNLHAQMLGIFAEHEAKNYDEFAARARAWEIPLETLQRAEELLNRLLYAVEHDDIKLPTGVEVIASFSPKEVGTQWDASGGHVFVEKPQADGTYKIFEGEEELFSGDMTSWNVSDGELFVEQKMPDLPSAFRLLKGTKKIFSGKTFDWKLDGGSAFILETQPDGQINFFKDKKKIYSLPASFKIKNWQVSNGSLFVLEKAPGVPGLQIDKADGKSISPAVYTGTVDGWGVVDGQLYVVWKNGDGTIKIINDNQEVFSGKADAWQVEGGAVYVRQIQPDGTSKLCVGDKELFSGHIDWWRPFHESVLVWQRQGDGIVKIFRNQQEIFHGLATEWQCEGNNILLRQDLADASTRFVRMKLE